MLRTVEPWLSQPPGRAVDVGGRRGELMGAFLERGFRVHVLDMAEGEPLLSQVTKSRSGFLDWCQYGSADLIVMSHVLEHTDKPAAFLNHARSILAPHGLLYVEVPFEVLTPLARRHIGDHRHVGYFTRTTLTGFLRLAGFVVLSCTLSVDLVGAPIPILRAVARAGDVCTDWRPGRFSLFQSLSEALHPLAFAARGRNQLVARWQSVRRVRDA
jgi:hypothetical protein